MGAFMRIKRTTGQVWNAAIGLLRLSVKLALVVGFVAGGLFIGGFFQFANTVTKSEPEADIEVADGIVVLTGGSTRIEHALDLLADRKGKRLLISGVNPTTRIVDLKSINPIHEQLFDCCVDVEHKAVDTVGNAVETQRWNGGHQYGSLILVTSGYHMPRSLLEFRRQMPDIAINPYPVPLDTINRNGWWRDHETLRFMLSEYVKYVGAFARGYLKAETFSALRASLGDIS